MGGEIPIPPLREEPFLGRPLAGAAEPERLLVVRFHAFGDTAITLPAIGALRRRLPRCRLDVVTDPRSAGLYEAAREIDRVFLFDTRAPRLAKGLALARLIVDLRREPPDAILDLQRSRWSLLLTRVVRARAWVAFDRFAPRTALTRYLEAIERIGLGRLDPVFERRAKPGPEEEARKRLAAAGRDPVRPLVCLNPAGGWETKQWPIERYAELGRRFEEAGCQLMALGTGQASERFASLRAALGTSLVDFSGTTTPGVAMALVGSASLVVSDDSGLMHLAWTQGVPTLALFGASRWVWSRPEGPFADGFYSEDLACGACMRPACARQDLLCLNRVSVQAAFERGMELMRLGGAARTT